MGQEILQKWEERSHHLHPRMEITGEGLVLGAGTVLTGTAEGRGTKVALADARRTAALLATAYERPVGTNVLAKIARACDVWNAGEKALAHIYLAHAGLPLCGEGQALRLFIAEELLENDVPPETLLKAQGFDPATLDLFKYPGQPRVPAGSGRESGEWTSGDAEITPVAFRGRERRPRHRGGDVFDAIRSFLDWLREWQKRKETEPAPETKPPPPGLPPQQPQPSDPNKLHHVFDKPGRGLESLVTDFGSQEAAFEAVKNATQKAVQQQNISGKYEIEITVHGHRLTVRGTVMNDGTLKIGTIFP